MFNSAQIAIINKLADENKIEPAALCAVIAIESGGKTATLIDGTLKPLIRFEGHYFDRRLSGAKKIRARGLKLAHPSAGKIKNPRTQKARYTLLSRAKAIHHQGAIESTSWGLGQVMGAHWNWLGYASADALMEEALSGFEGQLRLMLRFIVKSNLRPKIQTKDWKGFARIYNGPNFAKNRYDTKLARAYARFKKSGKNTSLKKSTASLIDFGANGEEVRSLQMLLTAKGYYCFQDGLFGAKTKAALLAFQRDAKLDATGFVDAETHKALGFANHQAEPGHLKKSLMNIGTKLFAALLGSFKN